MPDSIDEHIGRIITRRRHGLRLSQDQLGRQVGVGFRTIHKYECGAVRISAPRLYMIAVALDMSVGEFFAGWPRDAACTISRPMHH